MSDYDIITIGGGLGGAALAKSMAERGAKVLVLERETDFKDRVRGEGMTSWGAAEAKELGIYDVMAGCGGQVPWWDQAAGPMVVEERDVVATTPQGLPTLTFYHPAMQGAVLEAAECAGAKVRRSVRVTSVTTGKTPTVTVQNGVSAEESISARIVVGVDGRGAVTRKWGGFKERNKAPCLLIGGVLFEGSKAPEDRVRLVNNFETGRESIVFPAGKGRARYYFVCSVDDGIRLQGQKDVPRFIEQVVQTGMPPEYLESAEAAGPLATFDGADSWVDHPYNEGLVLIGDAAASSDPSWGQGLSLTLRDVRVLRDALLADDDWGAAGHGYATEHDRYFGVIRTVEDWFNDFALAKGPEADARRAKMIPAWMEDPTRTVDTFNSGPDHPVDEGVRARFFCEDVA
jgi:2-polyprenyl-6-methoxyphenol hydroxylase-like FAD-dependent oxidoreductase